MMAARLVELHRVLKPTGSLYLHCDPTASHYLKIFLIPFLALRTFVMKLSGNVVMGIMSAKRILGQYHDIILFYGKTDECYLEYKFIKPMTLNILKNIITMWMKREDDTGMKILLAQVMQLRVDSPIVRGYETLPLKRHWRYIQGTYART